MKNLRETHLLDNAQLSALERLQSVVLTHTKRLNLLSTRNVDSLWITLAEESCFGLQYLPTSGSVLDIGSGNGIPGLVWATLRQDLQFLLSDSVNKKARELEQIRQDCGLHNVTVYPGEVQTIRNQTFDVISARAVAPYPQLWGWTSGLRKVGTRYLLFRGSDDLQQNDQYAPEVKIYDCVPAGRIKLWVADIVEPTMSQS